MKLRKHEEKRTTAFDVDADNGAVFLWANIKCG